MQPISDALAVEASAKLNADVTFDYSQIWAHDLQGRASSFAKLVAGGMDVERAVGVTGLMVGE